MPAMFPTTIRARLTGASRGAEAVRGHPMIPEDKSETEDEMVMSLASLARRTSSETSEELDSLCMAEGASI